MEFIISIVVLILFLRFINKLLISKKKKKSHNKVKINLDPNTPIKISKEKLDEDNKTDFEKKKLELDIIKVKKSLEEIRKTNNFEKTNINFGDMSLDFNFQKKLDIRRKKDTKDYITETNKTEKIVVNKNYNRDRKLPYKLFYKSIPPYLNFKSIHKFYHFTDVKNLKSIIQQGGLYSWYGLESRQINSFLSSNQLSRELDTRYNLQDYIRLSFGSYHPMSSRLIHQEGKKLVWLEISLEVACFEETLFSDINATDNNVKIGNSLDFLKTIDLDVFKYQYRDLDYNAKKKYQAEILVKKFLPIKYITNIDTLRKEQNL